MSVPFQKFETIVQEHIWDEKIKKIIIYLKIIHEKQISKPADLQYGKDFLSTLSIIKTVIQNFKKVSSNNEEFKEVSRTVVVLVKVLDDGKIVPFLVQLQKLATVVFQLIEILDLISNIDTKTTTEIHGRILNFITLNEMHLRQPGPTQWQLLIIKITCEQVCQNLSGILQSEEYDTHLRRIQLYLNNLKIIVSRYGVIIKDFTNLNDTILQVIKISKSLEVSKDKQNVIKREILLHFFEVFNIYARRPCVLDFLSVCSTGNLADVSAAHDLAVELIKQCIRSLTTTVDIFDENTGRNLFIVFFNLSSTILNNSACEVAFYTNTIAYLTALIMIDSADINCFKKIEKFLCTVLTSSRNHSTLYLVINCWLSIARISNQKVCLKYFNLFLTALNSTTIVKVSTLQVALAIILQGFYICLSNKKKQELLVSGNNMIKYLDIVHNNRCQDSLTKMEKNIGNFKTSKYYNETITLIYLSSLVVNRRPTASLVRKISSLWKTLQNEVPANTCLQLVFVLLRFTLSFIHEFDKDLLNIVVGVLKSSGNPSVTLCMFMQLKQNAHSEKFYSILDTPSKDIYKKFIETLESHKRFELIIASFKKSKHICAAKNIEPPSKRFRKCNAIGEVFCKVSSIRKEEVSDVQSQQDIVKTINILKKLLAS